MDLTDAELASRRKIAEAKGSAAWKPAATRQRKVSQALQAYAAMTTSAARGAVRDVTPDPEVAGRSLISPAASLYPANS